MQFLLRLAVRKSLETINFMVPKITSRFGQARGNGRVIMVIARTTSSKLRAKVHSSSPASLELVAHTDTVLQARYGNCMQAAIEPC